MQATICSIGLGMPVPAVVQVLTGLAALLPLGVIVFALWVALSADKGRMKQKGRVHYSFWHFGWVCIGLVLLGAALSFAGVFGLMLWTVLRHMLISVGVG